MNSHAQNMTHWSERVDLAAAFRWTARLNMHEAVANHFIILAMDFLTPVLNTVTLAYRRPCLKMTISVSVLI